MATNLTLISLALIVLFQYCNAGGHGGGHKKVIIHVPYKVKTIHHTHTIVKHVDEPSSHDDESYSKVIGFSGNIDHGEIKHESHHQEELGTYGGGHGFALTGGHESGGGGGGGHQELSALTAGHSFGGGFGGGHEELGGGFGGGGHEGFSGGFGGGHSAAIESGQGGDWAGGASLSESGYGGDFSSQGGGLGGEVGGHGGYD